MWEHSINLWLGPPPWGESCHSQCCMPFAASSKASCCLLTEEPHHKCFCISTAVVFASSAEMIYRFFGRLLHTLQRREIKVILLLGPIYSQPYLTGKHCSCKAACSLKSNLLLLSPCARVSTITRISSKLKWWILRINQVCQIWINTQPKN